MSLLKLPAEIFLEVLQYIDALPDLVSLSMVKRSFYKILVPSYTDYFEIGCQMDNSDLWQHLQENPRLHKYIRKLVIIRRDMPQRLPRALDSARFSDGLTLDECFGLHCSLLSRMVNLKTFRLADPSLGNTSCILTALAKSKCVLEELKFEYFRDAYKIYSDVVKLSDWDFDWSRLSHLTMLLNSAIVTEDVFSIILTNCPNLVDLCFSITSSANLSRMLVKGCWSKMKRLSLWDEVESDNMEVQYYAEVDVEHRTTILQSFFLRHSLLEVLCFPAKIYPPDFLMRTEDILPNIKSFLLPINEAISLPLASRVEHIYASNRTQRLDLSLLTFGQFSNLRTCVIHGWCLPSNNDRLNLVELIPNVEYLGFLSGEQRRKNLSRNKVRRLVEACDQLSNLRMLLLCLSNLSLLELTQECNRTFMDEICRALPSTEYINALFNGRHSLVRLKKCPSSYKYLGYEVVSPMRNIIEPTRKWGGFLMYNSNME